MSTGLELEKDISIMDTSYIPPYHIYQIDPKNCSNAIMLIQKNIPQNSYVKWHHYGLYITVPVLSIDKLKILQSFVKDDILLPFIGGSFTFNVQLIKKNDITYIEFQRRDGDYFSFHPLVNNFVKLLIENNLIDITTNKLFDTIEIYKIPDEKNDCTHEEYNKTLSQLFDMATSKYKDIAIPARDKLAELITCKDFPKDLLTSSLLSLFCEKI
jgi:hypothetical protein